MPEAVEDHLTLVDLYTTMPMRSVSYVNVGAGIYHSMRKSYRHVRRVVSGFASLVGMQADDDPISLAPGISYTLEVSFDILHSGYALGFECLSENKSGANRYRILLPGMQV